MTAALAVLAERKLLADCQVIASLSGADLALVVGEPTIAGLHDFGRIAELAAHFSVPAVLCINKWDLNPELTQRLEEETRRREVKVVGRVRYSPAVTRAQRRGVSAVECDSEPVGEDLRRCLSMSYKNCPKYW